MDNCKEKSTVSNCNMPILQVYSTRKRYGRLSENGPSKNKGQVYKSRNKRSIRERIFLNELCIFLTKQYRARYIQLRPNQNRKVMKTDPIICGIPSLNT